MRLVVRSVAPQLRVGTPTGLRVPERGVRYPCGGCRATGIPTATTAVDSDGDGTNDNVEGTGDSDGDGIPDYLDDVNVARNVVQKQQATATQYLMETEPGLAISLGQVALEAGGHQAGVDDADVQSYSNNGAGVSQDQGYAFSSGLFDFTISELPAPGQQVKGRRGHILNCDSRFKM